MKTTYQIILNLFAWLLPLAAAQTQDSTPIPFSRIGEKATAAYRGEAIGILESTEGIRLHTAFQKLAGTVTRSGLVLDSTSIEGAGTLHLSANTLGRIGSPVPLPKTGLVQMQRQGAAWVRPGIIEEYSVSVDGLRQDFVVEVAPAGAGELCVELALSGARAEPMADGAKLTLDQSGRVLAYTKLHVSDAAGRTLAARLEVVAGDRLHVVVDDAGAAYPVRIDPTFSDANWVSLNPDGVGGANDTVNAIITDGSGNLYVGGQFTYIGNVPANRVAMWNGTTWSTLGDGLRFNAVAALALDPSGNLYAGGSFFQSGPGFDIDYIAKWNGSTWSAVGGGVNGDVNALVVDGAGHIYAGGSFSQAGGVTVNRVAKWDGSAWSGFGTGMDNLVLALALNGAGELHAGGFFSSAGGVAGTKGLAKWNGTAWEPLGGGLNSTASVNVLVADGPNDIYVGGSFSTAGGVSTSRIAKWNGTTWSALGAGVSSTVNCIALDSSGNLYAGGLFSSASGVANTSYIAKWNGSTWSALGTGMDLHVHALRVVGSDLYAGGIFRSAGGTASSRIAKWNGSAWSPISPSGFDGAVNATLVSGGNLYVGGDFKWAPGGVAVNRVAKWDGTAWSALGTGVNGLVYSLAMDGSGSLYVSGNFTTAGGASATRVAKWNGSTWSALGSGLNGPASALAVDSSGNLFAGGSFTNAGGVPASYIAKWNGSAWSAVGSGMGNAVLALVADAGGNIYAGGQFDTAGGANIRRVAKWDGSSWSGFGSGMIGSVNALALDANGNLYAGGSFSSAGGTPGTSNIAKWNGSVWGGLGFPGPGIGSTVNALTLDAAGNLFAGGFFTTAGGAPAARLARWNGAGWSAMGAGVDNTVNALVADASGHLFVGGSHVFAGSTLSPNIVQASLPSPAAPLVTASSSTDVTTTGATLGGNVTDDGFAGLVERGIVYSSTSANADPVTGGAGVTTLPTTGMVGVFTIPVSGLSGGTSYSFKAYAKNSQGTTYTSAATFTTLAVPPTVTTPTSAAVTANSATLGGNVTSDGEATITARGVVWAKTALNADPVLGGPDVSSATTSGTTGIFTVSANGLSGHTDYTFKAYATNSVGTTYTSAATFTTENTAPVAPEGSTTGTTGDTRTVTVNFPATDADGDPVMIVAAGSGPGVTVNSFTGTSVTFTPGENFTGNGSFSYSVEDGFGGSATGTVVVAVTDNDAPVVDAHANVGPVYAASGSSAVVTYAACSASDNIGVASISYSQNSGTLFPFGTTTVTITALDAAGNAGTSTFTVTVAGSGAADEFDAGISNGVVLATAVQPDGKIIIGGDFVARLNADGTFDSAFSPNANGQVWSAAVQADGKILIGGSFTTLEPNGGPQVSRNRIARLNADGTVDMTFDPNANGIVRSIAIQPDGKILIAGQFFELSPNGAASPASRSNVARLNADGTLDATFNPNPDTYVHGVGLQPDGKVLLWGSFSALQPNGIGAPIPRNRLARLNADGTLDMAFDPNPDVEVNTVVVQADGKILLGGQFANLQPNGAASPTPRRNVARVNADGTLDMAFDPSVDNNVYSLAVQADGKILIGGDYSSLTPNGATSPTTRFRMARVNADGTLDVDFDPIANNAIYSVAVQADGKVLIGGEFTSLGFNGASPIPRSVFARLLNEPATQTLTALNAAQVRWVRGGTAPEVTNVTFESSSDGGATWTLLPGAAVRIGTSADWALNGLALPASGHLRARGRTVGGYSSGSSGLVEQVEAFIAPNTPPTIVLPASPLMAEATSASGAVVNFTITGTDAESGVLTGSGVPASGSTFALGDTTVTATVTDGALSDTGSFIVRVRDTTAPAIVPPADVAANATSSTGALVSFPAASVTDAVTGSPLISYSHLSGSHFPIGSTVVTISATDAAGNVGTATFTVTVIPQPGTLSFANATPSANPVNTSGALNTVPVTIVRSGGTTGAVSVVVVPSQPATTPAGFAKYVYGTDYEIPGGTAAGATVSFADGEASAVVNIQLKTPVLTKKGQLRLALTTATGGAAIGTPASAVLTINARDTAPPTVVLNTPVAGATFGITGTVKDAGGLASLTVKVNGITLPLTVDPIGGYVFNSVAPYSVLGAVAENGNNTIVVTARDLSGNSTSATKTVTYANSRPALAGTYSALIVPTGVPNGDTAGFVTATVTTVGKITGRVTLSGATISFSGLLNNAGAATFGTTASTALPLLDGSEFEAYLGVLSFTVSAPGGISGTLSTEATGGSVLGTFVGTKNPYSTTNLVPSGLLNTATKGTYTVAFASKAQSPALAASAYPQGDGYASLTLTNAGAIAIVGKLADGTTLSFGGNLREDGTVPFFASLYKKLGLIAGDLAFADLANSDITGGDMLWIRPALSTASYYRSGWAGGIRIDAVGAKYIVPASLDFGQGAVNATTGNTTLVFSDGHLTSPITHPANVNPSNGAATTVPFAAPPYRLAFSASTGVFYGTFTHGANTATYRGVLINKGANKAGFGYFLGAVPLVYGASGESGGVSLEP